MRQMDSLVVTPKMIDEYLLVLEREGKKQTTLTVTRTMLRKWYKSLPVLEKEEKKLTGSQTTVRAWYKSLPAEKQVTAEILEEWERNERQRDVSEKTIQNRLRSVKTFLNYLDDPESFRNRGEKKREEEPSPEIATSREEYHLLLQTAKELGHRRTYLLIKTIVCLGMRSTEMPHLSVEELKQETVWIPFRDTTRSVKVFEPIRTELVEYAAERGIEEGAVFATKDGQPMQHFLIWKEIKKVCRRIGLPEYKGTPKSLYQLYVNTRIELTKASAKEVDKNYLALLEQEEALIGWD